MKIFISWSGKQSLAIAAALKQWLPDLFQGISLFLSDEDIRKGKRWPAEVSSQLETSNFGIVCLTPENLVAPWILFEAGALSKYVKEASVYTLLSVGLRPSDIEGPLSHFQHTTFEKEDFYKLVKSINEANGDSKQDERRLKKFFDMLWPELEAAITNAGKLADSKPEKKRSQDDILRELLDLTTHIARNLPEAREAEKPRAVPRLKPKSQPQDAWDDLVERVGKVSPFTKSYLLEAEGFFDAASKKLTVTYGPEFQEHFALVNNERNLKLVRQALEDMELKGWTANFDYMPF